MHFFLFFLSQVLLRLRGCPRQPDVMRLIILERASSIQYVNRKIGTLARVFRTPAHGNSKIEIRHKETWEEGKKRGMKVERSTVGTKNVPSAYGPKSLKLARSRYVSDSR